MFKLIPNHQLVYLTSAPKPLIRVIRKDVIRQFHETNALPRKNVAPTLVIYFSLLSAVAAAASWSSVHNRHTFEVLFFLKLNNQLQLHIVRINRKFATVTVLSLITTQELKLGMANCL
jgi:hypothetical protein